MVFDGCGLLYTLKPGPAPRNVGRHSWSLMMSDSYGSQLPVPAGRGVVIRDFIVFQIKAGG